MTEQEFIDVRNLTRLRIANDCLGGVLLNRDKMRGAVGFRKAALESIAHLIAILEKRVERAADGDTAP